MDDSVSLNKILTYCLLAALPLLLIAVIFNFPLLFPDRYIFWTDLEILGYMIQAEFLAAASGILLILPLLPPARSRLMKSLRMSVFIALGWAFSWIAYNVGGVAGMLFYALLIFVTYGGGTLFIFDWYSGTCRAFLSLLRWSMAVCIYTSLQVYYNLDIDVNAWKDTTSVITFGSTYFYLLSLFEIILYAPLTFYLENKIYMDRKLSETVDEVQIRTDNFFKTLNQKS